MSAAVIRPAARGDVPAVHGLVRELAIYEKLEHLCTGTVQALDEALFGEPRRVDVLVADLDGEIVGFALFFPTFSTFLARPGIWLEDLYVKPAHRGAGIGRRLLGSLAALAVERGCGRFEWAVLDWNAPAIAFYERMGATVLPDWRLVRVTGEPLDRLAASAAD
mgnify:CR=1 FL=1